MRINTLKANYLAQTAYRKSAIAMEYKKIKDMEYLLHWVINK